jgi:hypothetical protein
MRYTVTWKPSVKQRLADIWMTAPDRRAVTDAANAIDESLRVDPLGQGESRSGTARILIVIPLAVVYDVHQPDRLVEVLSVRHVPVPPRPDS